MQDSEQAGAALGHALGAEGGRMAVRALSGLAAAVEAAARSLDPGRGAAVALLDVATARNQAERASSDLSAAAAAGGGGAPEEPDGRAWLVECEHWAVPGRRVAVARSAASAARAAAALADELRGEAGLGAWGGDPARWPEALSFLRGGAAPGEGDDEDGEVHGLGPYEGAYVTVTRVGLAP